MSGIDAMMDNARELIRKGGEMVNQYERRKSIYNVLCIRRCDTITRLAAEFGVNERTIRRDIVWLTLSFPIETCRGRYGGVKLAEWFYPMKSYLCPRQLSALQRLTLQCHGDDLIAVNSIITQFSPRERQP